MDVVQTILLAINIILDIIILIGIIASSKKIIKASRL